MKHPLTSKERRGLIAVAAAALLCIASGFIFRSCSPRLYKHYLKSEETVDSLESGKKSHSVADKNRDKSKSRSDTYKKGKKEKKAKKKPAKTYPERDPLSQPCD